MSAKKTSKITLPPAPPKPVSALYYPPKLIEITSCGSVLEIEDIRRKNANQPEDLFVYRYIKSAALKGHTVGFRREYIEQQLDNYFKDVSPQKP